MVRVQTVGTIYTPKGYRKYQRILFQEIKGNQKEATEKHLNKLRRMMLDKIEEFSDTGTLARSIKLTGFKKTGKNRFTNSLVVGAEHGKYVEAGLWDREGYINVANKPALYDWAIRKQVYLYGPTSSGAIWMKVGGPDSRARKDKNLNRFFRPTIINFDDEYTSLTAKALERALIRSRKKLIAQDIGGI